MALTVLNPTLDACVVVPAAGSVVEDPVTSQLPAVSAKLVILIFVFDVIATPVTVEVSTCP